MMGLFVEDWSDGKTLWPKKKYCEQVAKLNLKPKQGGNGM